MNDIATIAQGEQRMTSLQIAEITGKSHAHLMRDIRKMEDAWFNVNQSKFGLVDYKDAKGELRPCYSLTKTECLYIATKFNDEARAKLIVRWEQLEKENKARMPQVPESFSQALLLAAKLQEEKEQMELKIEDQNRKLISMASSITSMERKVSYMDKVLACHSTVKVKVIAQDYGMSAQAFNLLLHSYGIQYKCGSEWILYARYINEGYVQSVSFEYTKTNGSTALAYNTQWTQKGRFFLYEFLKAHGILPLIEQAS